MTETAMPETGTRPALPTSLRRATLAVGVVAAVHLVALVLVLTHQGDIAATTAADHPDWAPDRVAEQASSQVWESVLPHVLIPVLLLWRASTLRSRRPRARVVLTVLLGVQLLAHASLPITLHQLPGYAPVVLAVQAFSLVFEVAALVLLWGPRDSREWFVAAPRG
jgi:hypothetical protein